MNKRNLESLVEQGLSTRKIGVILDKSQTSIRYWLKIHGLRTTYPGESTSANYECVTCGRRYTYERNKGFTKERCNSCQVNRRRFKLRKRIVAYLGGCCGRCGYNKCEQALHAHHTDPSEKSFNISGAHCRSWERIRKELDKCILLCANCHAEEHSRSI